MLRLFALLSLCAATAVAAPLPRDVATLQSRAEAATTRLATLNAQLKEQRTAHAQTVTALNHTTLTLLKLAQWPTPLLYTRTLTHPAPSVPTLLRLGQQALQQRQSRLANQLQGYLKHRAEAAAALADLQALTASLAAARGRLSRQQQQALAAARLKADVLEALLTTQPSTNPTPASRPTATRLQPVAGQALPTGDEGTTYLATAAAPVHAVMAGEVAYSGPFRHLGGLVITQNTSGLYTVYMGLGTLAVSTGDAITVGTPLGSMPATPARPKLYFEVRKNGRPLANFHP